MLTQKTQREERDRDREHLHTGERERPLALWLLFFYIFLLPLGLPYVNWASQAGVLFVLPEVLTPFLGPSFVLFLRAYPFLVFYPPPFWTPFSYSNCITFPLFHSLNLLLDNEIVTVFEH